MKVLLIWPFNKHAIEIQEIFPLGLGYILPNIDKARYETTLMDCTLDRIAPDSEEFIERLVATSPDVVGISFWSSNAESIYQTCETIRRVVPKAVIVFGGPHATAYGTFEMQNKRVDYVLAGEGELSFPMFLDAIDDGALDGLSGVPGLMYFDRDDKLRENPFVFEDDLDSLGYVDYKTLRLGDYHRAGYVYGGVACLHPELKTGLILSTRGCAYRCRFCLAPQLSGRKIRYHSPEYITRTITDLYHNFDVRVVSIGDDNFSLSLSYTMDVFRAIIALGLDDLIMVAPAGMRMKHITPEFLALMKKAGFEEVTIAPESGSRKTLELMQKDVDLDHVRPFIEMCRKAGLKVKANFIIAYPGETMADVLLTESFIKGMDFDQISLCFFQPLPGTPIFDELMAEGRLDESFVPGRYSQLTYCPDGIDDKEALCDVFNRIMNDFRDSKGWKYKNARVGTVRESSKEVS